MEDHNCGNRTQLVAGRCVADLVKSMNPKPVFYRNIDQYDNIYEFLYEILDHMCRRRPKYDANYLQNLIYIMFDPSTPKRKIKGHYLKCLLILYNSLSHQKEMDGLVIPTSEEIFGHKCTFGDAYNRLCGGCEDPGIQIHELFDFLGIQNSVIATTDCNLTAKLKPFLRDNEMFNTPICRASIKKLRSQITPDTYHFMPRRKDCPNLLDFDKRKTLQSYILGKIAKYDRYKDEMTPAEFIRGIRDHIRHPDTEFSSKHQWTHPVITKFIHEITKDMNIKRGNGIVKFDNNGILRLCDSYKHTAKDYLTDRQIKSLYGCDKKTVMDRYGATSDIDLLIKTNHMNPSLFDKVSKMLHKMFDYSEVRNTMTGLTSLTLSNILMKLSRNKKDFSYMVYALPKDCENEDLWADSKKNHVIICSNTFKNTPHWFCMGRFCHKDIPNYFLYCSCNSEESIFSNHLENLINRVESDIKSCDWRENDKYYLNNKCKPKFRAPTNQNQKGGNNCGFWTANLCRAIAGEDFPQILRYFTQKVTESELLRDSSKFLLN